MALVITPKTKKRTIQIENGQCFNPMEQTEKLQLLKTISTSKDMFTQVILQQIYTKKRHKKLHSVHLFPQWGAVQT